MENKVIEYDSRDEFFKSPFGATAEGIPIVIRAGIPRSLGQCQAVLVASNDETRKSEEIQGEWISMKAGRDYYEFRWTPQTPGLYFYHIRAITTSGLSRMLTSTHQSQEYQQTVYRKDFSVPKWLGEGIMYQIFPDRFAKSRSYEAPQTDKDYILRSDWGGRPDGRDENGVVKNNDFFGGNLAGIQERLGYLSDLGVTVIYLNPITEAYSNHRYDTADYRNVDPLLGTNEDFRKLCSAAAEKGIRIILDGVFNHTGDDSIYFNRKRRYDDSDGKGENGAYNSRNSKYYRWYSFTSYPDKYESWWGIDTLPKVKEEDESYLDFIIRDEDSVINHWLSLGASGFRLDVADELPDIFIEELRKHMKARYPDSVLIGEVWEDASNKISYGYRRKYLQGSQLDSVMNYPFKKAIIGYMETGDAKLLSGEVETIRENYPPQVLNSLMNILGTHDTARILTVFAENEYHTAKRKLCLSVILWAFLPGTPCIYYGDETGMTGGKDPLNRGCFEIEKKNDRIYYHYKDVLSIRKRMTDIGSYDCRTVRDDDGAFVFTREKKPEPGSEKKADKLLAGVNLGEEKIIHLPFGRIRTFFRMGKVEVLDPCSVKLGKYAGIIVTGNE